MNPLKVENLKPSFAVMRRVAKLWPRPQLQIGMACEWAFEEWLDSNGVAYEESDGQYAPYDRMIDGIYYDDKVATYLKVGAKNRNEIVATQSMTHTLSRREVAFMRARVKEGKRVIINSFSQLHPHPELRFTFILNGQYDFEKLDLIQSREPGKFFFWRKGNAML